MSAENPKSPSESFAEMMKNFGSAIAEIFNDPALKEKAKDFGESASLSAKAFAGRFKDEEVKSKFRDLGAAAKNFGESVTDYFKDDKAKGQEQTPGPDNTAQETGGGPKKKQDNIAPEGAGQQTTVQDSGNICKESKADKRFDESRARNARIAGYGFAIAWSIIFIIFFNFFNKYIAYYEYNAASSSWSFTPFITSGFDTWLPIFNAATIIAIIGNIVLIVNDSFYFDNITNIVMHILGIVSVATLFSLFPFDFSVIPDANLNPIIFPVLRIVFIFILVGLSIGILVRFIRIIIKIARTS
jgi:hypothetical protein